MEDLEFNPKYKNQSQKIRDASEKWVKNYLRCPACDGNLIKLKNNSKAKDFVNRNQDCHPIRQKLKRCPKVRKTKTKL